MKVAVICANGKGQGSACVLLPFLSGAGREKRYQKYCVLLHFHRRISFPKWKGRRNCHRDGTGMAEKKSGQSRGDFQCFQGLRL